MNREYSVWVVHGPGGERLIQRFQLDAESEARSMNAYYQRLTKIPREPYEVEKRTFSSRQELEDILGFPVSEFTFKDWTGGI